MAAVLCYLILRRPAPLSDFSSVSSFSSLCVSFTFLLAQLIALFVKLFFPSGLFREKKEKKEARLARLYYESCREKRREIECRGGE